MLSISEKLCLFQILILFNIFYSTAGDRKSVVKGKSVKISVDLGGRRIIKKKNRATERHAIADQQRQRRKARRQAMTDLSTVFFNSLFFFFKQKTAYEISECDWSSDVCSSD